MRSSGNQHKLSPVGNLTCDTLKTVLMALSIDGGDQRGAAPYQRTQERRNWAQEGWIDAHVCFQSLLLKLGKALARQ